MTNSLLSSAWFKALKHFDRIYVGYSGGLDSTALLHNLSADPFISSKLIAVHINHGLSPNANIWQNHCQKFCQQRNLNFQGYAVNFERQANIENAARQARYKLFASLMSKNDCLILGHHSDDQAETLLLQLFRGAGIDGLAAMQEKKAFAQGQLIRPFLNHSRQQIERYAQNHRLSWIEDESNQDSKFTRNYLRSELIPKLAQRWPGIESNLVRAAKHCQQAKANLDDLAKMDCPDLEVPSPQIKLSSLKHLLKARLSNVLRFWIKENSLQLPSAATFDRIINELIIAKADASPVVNWSNVKIRRYQDVLYLEKTQTNQVYTTKRWECFPNPLKIEGFGTLFVKKSTKGLVLPYNSEIEIRFRQGGEIFNFRGQSKNLKKLLQEWKLPPWRRDSLPLLYLNSQLAAVIGFAISDLFYREDSKECYEIYLEP